MYSIHICTVSIYMDGRVRFEGRYRFVYIRTHGWIHSRYTLYYGHPEYIEILLMEEILHHLIGTSSLSHYLQGFIHPRWCRISSINSTSTQEKVWNHQIEATINLWLFRVPGRSC